MKILQNIARGCRCRQSSIDSRLQRDPGGASAAVHAARTGKSAFVTLAEDSPWWEIDLGTPTKVDSIVVYNWDVDNAPHAEAGRSRCRFLQISGSNDGTDWILLHDRREGQTQVKDFGGIVHGPLYVDLKNIDLRFLRLTILGGGILHLNSVQLFADRDVDIDTALLSMFLYANELNLKIANRIFAALELLPSDLIAHAERLDVKLRPAAVWFIFHQLISGGRAGEAQSLLKRNAGLLGFSYPTLQAVKPADQPSLERPDTINFDRLPGLETNDLHYWICAIPGLATSSFEWIDKAYRFRSLQSAGEIDRRATVLYDDAQENAKSIYFCGGCEFSYAGYFLSLRKYQITNTFLEDRSCDPVAHLAGIGRERLARLRPDLIILSTEQSFKQLLLKIFRFQEYPREEQLADLEELIDGLDDAVATARRISPGSKIILLSHISYSNRAMHLFEESTFSRMRGNPYTMNDFSKAYDLKLASLSRKHDSLLLDFEEVCSKFGKSSADGRENHARAEDYLGGHPELTGARMIANTVDGWISALYDEKAKIRLIVLDLDNTLWDGNLRDDGVEHVTTGIRSAHCYAALHLARQGLLLAVCSKNHPQTARELMAVLVSKYPDFGNYTAALRVNWLPKSENIKSIASQLNVGLDRVAFFDDQAFERAEVSSSLPQVRVFTDADLLQVGRYAPFLPSAPVSANTCEDPGEHTLARLRCEEESIC